MTRFFHDACLTLRLGNGLMLAGLVCVIIGIGGGYVLSVDLSLFLQVVMHLLLLVSPILLKVGYLLRLNARQRLSLRC